VEDDYEEVGGRERRQAEQYEYTPSKTRCPLLLVADYRFYQEMGGSNTKTTINYLVSHPL
jgi:disintegrin and metalloproteinase domain-containing protein 17